MSASFGMKRRMMRLAFSLEPRSKALKWLAK